MNKVIIALSMLLMCCQQNVDSNLKVYEIEDFFNNVSISGGYFSTDGEKIIYSRSLKIEGVFNSSRNRSCSEMPSLSSS